MTSDRTKIGTSFLGEVTIPSSTTRDPYQYIKTKERVRTRVRECTKCPLHGECSGPVPFASPSGSTIPDLVLLGEAPGNMEDRRGIPFVGKTGTHLREKLHRAGIQDQDVAFANAVSCRPTASSDRITKDRTPTHDESVACRGNLFDQLEAIGPRFILCCGSTATKAFRPDLKIGRNHGRLYVWEGSWLTMITYHPSAAIRDRRMDTILRDDVAKMAGLIDGSVSIHSALSPWCTKCGWNAVVYDPNMAGWCQEHWDEKAKPKWPSNRQMWHMSTREGQWKGKGRKRGTAIPQELF